jgi:SPP1 gp7 family putative phage head morphogenesis protein
VQIPDLLRGENAIRELQGRPLHKPRKPRIQRHPDSAERAYRSQLIGFVDSLVRDVEALLIPRLKGIEAALGNHKDAAHTDAAEWVRSIQDALTLMNFAAERRMGQQRLIGKTGDAAREINRHNRLQVFRQIKGSVGIDVVPPETGIPDFVDDWISENTALIESIPADLHQRVARITRDEFRQGQRAEVVEEKIRAVFPVTRNRAILIARDQSNKLNGQLTRKRQTGLGIESYIWRTSNDDRVRVTHAENNGKVFKWNNPPAETGHPGQDINCRCTAEPVFEDLF